MAILPLRVHGPVPTRLATRWNRVVRFVAIAGTQGIVGGLDVEYSRNSYMVVIPTFLKHHFCFSSRNFFAEFSLAPKTPAPRSGGCAPLALRDLGEACAGLT